MDEILFTYIFSLLIGWYIFGFGIGMIIVVILMACLKDLIKFIERRSKWI